MCDGKRGFHPWSDCGRKVLLSSLQRMCLLRDEFVNSRHRAVLAQMGSDCVSDSKWGIIRHFRLLLMLLEDWPDFQMYQAINCPLLISVGSSQPSCIRKIRLVT